MTTRPARLALTVAIVLAFVTGLAPRPEGAPSAAAAAAFPLGTVTVLGAGDGQCPSGFSCTRFQVACPDISAAREGFYATSSGPSTGAGGVIVFFSGGGGTKYFGGEGSSKAALADRLYQQHGYRVVQVRWAASWHVPPTGERPGPAKMACRPATIVKHLHDTLYAPLGLRAASGTCGFCIVGGSGGTAQVAYPLSHYGLDGIVGGAFPYSGPTHAAIAKGCRRDIRADDQYWYSNAANIDEAYGFLADGPCRAHDVSWVPTWERDSVDTQGSDYRYDTTRIHIILGETDMVQIARAGDYVARLTAASSPFVGVKVVAGMGHGLTTAGVLELEAGLLWGADHGMHACNNGLDDDGDGLTDAGPGNDPGCATAGDISERGSLPCDDGVDQDGDGRADAPRDTGCAGPSDLDGPGTAERDAGRTCDNALDDDGDGRADFPADIGCTSPADSSPAGNIERDPSYPCDNGLDDDGDGKIDHRPDGSGDPQCTSPETPSETGGDSSGSTLYIGDASVREPLPGELAACRLNVQLSPATTTRVTVRYETSDGTAVSPADYAGGSGTVKIRPGKTKRVLKVPVYADTLAEPTETFTVRLSNPTGAALGASEATCSIVDRS